MGHKLLSVIIVLLAVSFVSAMADSGQLSVVSGLTYQINYKTTDATIQSIQDNKDSLSLELTVHATSPAASVELTLPRDLIDAKNNDGSDEVFIVLVDGTFATYTETSASSQTRTILIPLNSDNKDIEIIGTSLGTAKLISQNNTHPTLPTPKPVESQSTQNKTTVQTPSQPTESQSNMQNKTQNVEPSQNILQQIISVIHSDWSKLHLNLDKKQFVEYSIVTAIVIVIIVVIASSVKKSQKKTRK